MVEMLVNVNHVQAGYREQELFEFPALGLAFVSVKDFGAVGDGVHDDSAAIQSAIDANAGTGVSVWFPAGVYKIATPIALLNASDTSIWMGPGVTLLSTITPGFASVNRTIFYAAQPTTGAATVLSANAVVGSNIIHTVAAPTVGTEIALASAMLGEQIAYYDVVKVTGAGPFTVTLDREVRRPYVIGDAVQTVTARLHRLIIRGNHAKMTGTGDRYIELLGAKDCLVEDLILDTSIGAISDLACSFDVGSYRCVYRNIKAQGITPNTPNGSATHGIALEVAEDCHIEGCEAIGWSFAGFTLLSAVDCIISASHGRENIGNGCVLTADVGEYGCLDCQIMGGDFNSNQASNVVVAAASEGTQMVAVDASYCSSVGGAGLLLDATGGALHGTKIVACKFSNNANVGIINGATNLDTTLTGVETNGNASAGIITSANMTIDNWTSSGNLGTFPADLYAAGTAQVIVEGYVLTNNVPNGNNILVAAAASLFMSGGLTFANGNGATVAIVNGYLFLEGCKWSGAGVGVTGVFVNNNGTFDQGSGVDLSHFTTNSVFLNSPTAYWNRTLITAAGTGLAQTVPYPKLNADHRIHTDRLTTGGVPTGGGPLIVKTAGVGWTDTFSAADTSNYEQQAI
jgi:hypothetical protein